MTLQVELSGRLDSSGAMASLTAELGGASGDLRNVDIAISVEDMSGATEATAALDLGPLGDTVGNLVTDLGTVVGDLPVADDLIGPIRSGFDVLDGALSGNLGSDVTSALDRLGGEFEALEGGTILSGLRRLAEALGGDGEFGAVLSAAQEVVRLAGGRGNVTTGFGDIVAAVLELLEAIGAMMTLETMLAEAQRLGQVVELQLPEGRFRDLENICASRVLQAEAALDGLDVADNAAVDAAFGALASVRAGAREMLETLRGAMAFGEATLTYADPERLVARTEAVLEQLRGVATDEVEAAMSRVADLLGPVLRIDVAGAPQMTLDSLFSQVEAQVADIAAEIASLDLSAVTDPLTEGLGTIAGVTEDISTALDNAVVTVETALGAVRDAIKGLPFDQVVQKLQQVTGVIAGVLSTLGDLLGAAQATIGSAASAAQAAIARAEAAVDAFRAAIEQVFQEARTFIDSLGLDSVVGRVADEIQKISDLIGQADMAPYFATAQDAIGSTADVIDKVPFSLLPDEMEQEVVDLVRPIKTADVQSFRAEILRVLQIEEDGTFALRDDLEAAVSEVQEQFDALVTAMQDLDPQKLAEAINSALDDVRSEIETIAPAAELRPLTEALDEAKAVVAGLDLAAILQPLSDGFETVLAQIDEFQPSALIAPLDAEVDALRQKFLELSKLEEWQTHLDDVRAQALDYVTILDPARIEAPLREAFADAQRRLAAGELPDPLAPLGAVVSALMSGGGEALSANAIDQVKAWLRGSSAGGNRLTDLANRFAASVAAARREVNAVDPAALAARVQVDASRLSTLIESLPAGPARDRLATAAEGLDLSADLRLLGPPHAQFRSFLDQAEALARDLATKGFGEVDTVSRVLRAALSPLLPLFEAPRTILQKMGFDRLQGGLPGIIGQLFEIASPERLANILMPIYSALHGRVEALLDSIIAPLREMIANLLEIVNLFDLTRLSDALDGIHQAIREEIAAFHPDNILGSVTTAFAEAQAAVAAFDPLGPVIETLDTLKATVIRVLEKLDGEALLAVPIEIFDTVMDLLRALDLNGLLGPLYDRLDAIAAQVADGLEGTVDAFEDLQDALPGQVGSTSISGSASVSVGG